MTYTLKLKRSLIKNTWCIIAKNPYLALVQSLEDYLCLILMQAGSGYKVSLSLWADHSALFYRVKKRKEMRISIAWIVVVIVCLLFQSPEPQVVYCFWNCFQLWPRALWCKTTSDQCSISLSFLPFKKLFSSDAVGIAELEALCSLYLKEPSTPNEAS